MIKYKLTIILTIVFLLGIYTRNGIFIYEFFVPYPLCLISGFGLFLINVQSFKINEIIYLAIFLFYVSITIIINPEANFIFERIKGVIQIILVVFTSFSFFLSLEFIKNEHLVKFSQIAVLVILILSILELIPSIFRISNQIKLLLLPIKMKDIIFQINRNNIVGGGWIRPFPFATEPSYVAMFVNIMMFTWLLFTNNKNKVLIYLAFAILVILISRSLLSFLLLLNFFIYTFIYEKEIYKSKKIKLMIISMVISAVSLGMYVLSERLGNIVFNKDPSFLARIIVSMKLMYTSLKTFPLFGVGIMNNEWIIIKYSQIINDLNYLKMNIKGNLYIMNILNAHFAYFGVLGGLFLLYIFNQFIKSIKVNSMVLVYYFILIFSLSLGTYTGQMFWGYTFYIIGIIKKREKLLGQNYAI